MALLPECAYYGFRLAINISLLRSENFCNSLFANGQQEIKSNALAKAQNDPYL